MITIIAEKPSVAKDIARVLEIKNKGEGFLFNDKFNVTWAFGHLIELADPGAYGFTSWQKNNLPIIPGEFKLNIKQIKTTDNKSMNDPGVEKQLSIIKTLFEESDSIIVATDAGREGELIFRYIYHYLGIKKPFKRLWISSLTDTAIKEGFDNLKEGKEYDKLYESAKARSEADWLVGINATQALTLAVNKGLLSLGRVQTPTLALICKRHLENTDFKTTSSFILRILCQQNNIIFPAEHIDVDFKIIHFSTKDECNLIKIDLSDEVNVIDIKNETKKESPPLLYDLTALQIDANKKHGLSANDTLKAAQELYEGKYITYPRTGSRYISEDVFETIPGLIKVLSTNNIYLEAATELLKQKLNTRSVDASKVTDHHALLTTVNKPSNLISNLLNVYNLIAARLLEAFNQTCEKNLINIILKVKGNRGKDYLFIAKETKILITGWRSVLNYNEEEITEENIKLPLLTENQLLPIKNKEVVEIKTKPKPLHTEASLLKEMETCGKDIEDDNMRLAMKESGLGTPATRAATIETLFKRMFIERKKKSLIPTDKGLLEYSLVKNKKISQPLLTGEWEKKLEDIKTGSMPVIDFNREIITYTSELVKEILSINSVDFKDENTIICPLCNKGEIIIRPMAAGCTQYKEGCTFSIFRKIASKDITDSDIKDLISKRKSKLIKGFKSKTGNDFEAFLVLNDLFKISFEFNKTAKK